jgi:hypothetical protein
MFGTEVKVLTMTSYLAWLLGTSAQPAQAALPAIFTEPPEIEIIEPVEEEEHYSDDGYETDRPPAFPALNSPQRAAASSKSLQNTSGIGLMGPPPARLKAGAASSGAQHTAANSLAPLTTTKVAKKNRKVALAPGHSTLDWANLKTSGVDLRVCVILHRCRAPTYHIFSRVE